MEHEVSAIYDITHGLGLAILTPRWMEYTLNEKTVSKFVQYGVNVFGIDPNLPAMDIAKRSIALTAEFLSKKLELESTFTEIGIDDTNFAVMAEGAVRNGGLAYAFQPLTETDVANIFRMCL